MNMNHWLRLRRRKGAAMLVNMIIVALMMGVMATSFVQLSSAQLSSTDAYRVAFQAQQLCESKANEVGVVSYGMLANEPRAVVTGATDWQREVVLGVETNLGGNNYQREVTINVYYGSETIPRATVKKYPTIAGQIVAPGTITIWSGLTSAIPYGWLLCDGTNGTPDLRSRFVYGAGGDGSAKTAFGNGWNVVVGHYSPGVIGGEEQHVLLVNEMPNHNHNGSTSPAGAHTHYGLIDHAGSVDGTGTKTATIVGGTYSNTSWEPDHSHGLSIGYTGGGQAHNILPRFMALAYIMKR